MRRAQQLLLAGALALVPATAQAQSSPVDRLFFEGLGAVTFGAATDAAAAGQVGFSLTRRLAAFGEVGRMRNVIPGGREAAMEQVVSHVYLRGDVPVSVDAAYRANYGLAGARWAERAFFVEGGVGMASVRTQIGKVVTNGADITTAYLSTLPQNLPAARELLVAVGAGINKRLSQTMALDLGYRYTWIDTFAPAVNANMVYAGVRFGGQLR